MEDSRIEALLDAVPALAVLAGLRLDLFTHAASEPRTAAELAERVGGDERRLEALLHALAALDLLEVRPASAGGGPPRFLCRPAAARRLAAGGAEYAGHGRELAARLWAAGLTVADSIRQGAATAPHAAGGDSAEETGDFLRALHPGAVRTGREIARRGWLEGCRRIVDAGGGSGGLAAALHQDLPDAEVSVVERGPAAPWTRRLLEEEGAAGVRVVEGDLVGAGDLEGRLDLPCDGVVCLSFLQVLGPEEAARVIARIAGWLRPGGRLVIAGMGVLADDRLSPRDSAVHNILLGALYEGGRGYTLSEHRRWLEAAGFTEIEWDELSDGRGAVRAVRR